MQVTCPVCFARFALEAALTDADARRACQAVAALPPQLGELALQYAGLFRHEGRALAWRRVAAIIEELSKAVQSGIIRRARQQAPAPASVWRAALEQMVTRRDLLDLPLTGHGYLYQTVFSLATKRAESAPTRPEPGLPAEDPRGNAEAEARLDALYRRSQERGNAQLSRRGEGGNRD